MPPTSLDAYVSTRELLGRKDGHIPDWRRFGGCQMISTRYRALLSCPEREAVWQCEVIGPHTRHRWSDHLIAHERFGNGHSCWTVGDDLKAAMKRLYPWNRIGQPVELSHPYEGDGPYCTAWIEGRMGGGDAGTITWRSGCGYPPDAHGRVT